MLFSIRGCNEYIYERSDCLQESGSKSGIRKLEENDLEGAHISIGKAKAIISELRTSLDTDKGGEVAKNLERLYLYMFNRLIDANVKKDADSLREVLSLVSELREGWSTVTNKGQKKTAPVGIAPRGNYGAAGGVKKPLKIRG